jgi:hypothetical protein
MTCGLVCFGIISKHLHYSFKDKNFMIVSVLNFCLAIETGEW